MAASSTARFIFDLSADERFSLLRSTFANTITVVCERSVRKKKILFCRFILNCPEVDFIHKIGFSFLELRKQNNDFYEVPKYQNSTKYLLQKIKLSKRNALECCEQHSD